jgi:hypothetical protein
VSKIWLQPVFCQIAAGIDEKTWLFDLRNNDDLRCM